MSEIKFPQPVAPGAKVEYGTLYFLAVPGQPATEWKGGSNEAKWLKAGLIYLTEAERDQRLAWEAQENVKRIIPQWYRDLGPDVEWFNGISWYPAGNNAGYNSPPDWSKLNKSHYRAKPKQIVRTVDGVEYRWDETPQSRTHSVFWSYQLERFVVNVASGVAFTLSTEEDAKAKCAALNAVLGVSDA